MAEDTRPVVVVGPGAVGTMLAAQLQRNLPGQRVYLAGSTSPSPETSAHLDEIMNNGVHIHGESAYTARPLVCRGAVGITASHLFFTVKAGRVGEAAAEFSKMAGEGTITAVFSNGLDVCKDLPPAYRKRGVVRGLVNTGAEIEKPGQVHQFGALDVTLAPGPGAAEDAALVGRLAELLGPLGIRVRQERDGEEAEWRKAVANAVINPLGAALELRNGELLDTPSAAVLVDALAKELQALIDAEGMALDALEIVRETARATAGNRNSMWQDLMRGRRSEIREVTGRFIERADARGVLFSAHKALYYRILSLERDSVSQDAQGEESLDTEGGNS
ncbi:MAG: 2-dehydropantoate 2-reductase [Nitrospinae bacterium]|nr:2-dehydropantoate 2-reductase [Nitrospinota bacterium]